MSETDNRRILIVDDNRAIHDDFNKILRSHVQPHGDMNAFEESLFGEAAPAAQSEVFTVDSAYQGREGLQLVQRACECGQPYAMAFMDVRMPPGWDGIETTREIWKIDPDIQIVICTAYSDYSWSAMTDQLGQSDRLLVLKKPFENIEVLQIVHVLTAKWTLSRNARQQAYPFNVQPSR